MTKINFLTQILMIIFNQTNILAFNNFITIVMEQVGPRLSYWEYEIYFKDVDVFVIGSGIVGLSTAISIKEKNSLLKIVILERGALPMGASTRNAGFACYGSMTELIEDVKRDGEDMMLELVKRRFEGLELLKKRIAPEKMNFRHQGGFEIFRSDDMESYEECLANIPYYNKLVEPITGLKNTYTIADNQIESFGFKGINHMILNQGEGELDTGLMMEELILFANKLNIRIINGINIESYESSAAGITLLTDKNWELKSKKLVIATNGFSKNLLPNIEVTSARNQVLVTDPIDGLKLKGCFHYDRGYFYFREINNRILIGGGRNLAAKAETTDSFGINNMIQSALSQLLRTTVIPYTTFEIDRRWSGILGLGPVKKPIIEKIDENVVVAVRMGGMGVAIGSLVGSEAADLILEA